MLGLFREELKAAKVNIAAASYHLTCTKSRPPGACPTLPVDFDMILVSGSHLKQGRLQQLEPGARNRQHRMQPRRRTHPRPLRPPNSVQPHPFRRHQQHPPTVRPRPAVHWEGVQERCRTSPLDQPQLARDRRGPQEAPFGQLLFAQAAAEDLQQCGTLAGVIKHLPLLKAAGEQAPALSCTAVPMEISPSRAPAAASASSAAGTLRKRH